MKLKVLKLSKGASGIEVKCIDKLGKLSFHLNYLNLIPFTEIYIKEVLDAVGMPVTRHPPHRSQRALLMHWAPASSIDAHTFQWIRMKDKRAG